MKLFGIEITRAKEAVNIDKSVPQSQNIAMKVVPRQSTRVTQDITKWRRAIQQAESDKTPDRKPLQELFNEIHFDSHISALMNHVILYLQATDWCVYDETKIVNGEIQEDEEAENVLDDKWFQDFIKECSKAEIYGYSLINFGDIKNNKFTEVKSIDRRYVIPELHSVRKDLWNSSDLIDYENPIFKNWVIFVGEPGELGLLNKAAPYWIYKKQALASWAEYQQILGIPPRIGKTDIRNDQLRQNMTMMLRDMGHASYGVFDKDDSFEFVSPVMTGQAENAFKSMIETLNKELSKLFVGQTMTTEDGSSKSQSETHSDIFEMLMQGRKQSIEDVINKKLKPILLYHGMWTNPNLIFRFKEKEEELNHQAKVDTIDKLGKYFNFTPEFIQDYLGVQVEEKQMPPNFSNQPQEQKQNILKNYYSVEDFKHGS